MSEEEVKQLKLERDTAIFVARERLDHIEKVQNQKEIFELRYLKEERKKEELNKRIEELELDLQHTNSQLANVSKRCIKAIEYIDKNGMTNITCLGNQTTKRELFKENGSLYELREILVGSDKRVTLKEALDNGYCNLEDDIDFDDTPQGEKIACLKLEIEGLKSQLQQKENTIKKIENDINNIKDIVKKQPSDDPDTDNWIQIRLNGLLYIIKEGNK